MAFSSHALLRTSLPIARVGGSKIVPAMYRKYSRH